VIPTPNTPGSFPELTDEQVAWLCGYGKERSLEGGEYLFKEQDYVNSFYVVLEGEIRISRVAGDGTEDVVTTHPPGGFTGQLAVMAGKRSRHRARAVEPSRVLEITADAFRDVTAANSDVADVFISTLTRRMRETQTWMRQTEKLAALGKLSAGLAHELNNPASAARRAALDLREAALRAQETALRNDARFSPEEKERLATLRRGAVAETIVVKDPLVQGDKEDELADRLEQRGVEDAWELAPTLVAAGLDAGKLENLADGMNDEALAGAVGWLGATLSLVGLADEVEKSTGRISELVGAMKQYSYMDKASLREVDVHDGLENTLTILGHKLKKGVDVERDYDRNLPHIYAHGGELNQVWTNIVDNAADAMKGEGWLLIRTSQEDSCVVVEITDSGPGVPKEIQNRIFEPFFTTKGVGEGTGLGLDIARRIVVGRHGGDIRVDSKPGETRFRVRLPLDPRRTNGG
jgi:signal transduction histidine kinase